MFSRAVGGRALQTHISGVCGERSQCLGHPGFAPAHGVCAFLVYTAQAPGCSAGEMSKAGPGWHALPRSKPLRFRFSRTPQRHRLGLRFMPCPGLSSSGGQVLAEHAPRRAVRLFTSLVLLAWFPGRAAGAPCHVCGVSPLWG